MHNNQLYIDMNIDTKVNDINKFTTNFFDSKGYYIIKNLHSTKISSS